jgi:GLPGLI family protein
VVSAPESHPDQRSHPAPASAEAHSNQLQSIKNQLFMQKILLLAAALLFGAPNVHGQAPTEASAPPTQGTIRYLVTHNWTKKLEALSYLSKQRKERAAYMWGNNDEWREYTLLHFDSTHTKYEDSEERAERDDSGYSWRRETYFTTRDFEQKTQFDALTLQGKTYLVQDSLGCQNWKILNDLKEVAGHLCMNAQWQDTLKGQKIIAWFALDIPHSGGPERLCGLPGLILEADINNGAMLISADRIEAKTLTKELELPKKLKGKKSSEAQYQAALKKYIDERVKNEEPYFWGIRY